ncbi:MazG family protein [Paenisporosarcina cavernae]|uniref:MazG family protein n=1 Tax=Paenisporosarcina cavernae TaxID=2320858 RepID=A0A385YZB2_9BACL|nr:MazG family protein [Paenisporosarcina cavernae]
MKTITVVGLGAGDLEQLPLGIYRHLQQAKAIYLRTNEHPVVEALQAEGMTFESFDAIYLANDSFEKVYEEIVQYLVEEAAISPITYAVPGHPLVAEKTVQLLLEKHARKEIHVDVLGGQSFLDPMFGALGVDPIEGFQLLDATDLSRDDVMMKQHIIIGQVYDQYRASDVKLTLLEKYPETTEVTIVTAAGTKSENVRRVPLLELDREVELNNLTSVYVPPMHQQENRYKEWGTFREIIAKLRSPEGCPWDREQRHESLKKYLIEETQELIEAIDQQDDEGMIEELGDVLLQVFLHAQIGEEEGYFQLEDVLERVSSKMVFRHPHVFGDVEVTSAEEVKANWQKLKQQEKQKKGE